MKFYYPTNLVGYSTATLHYPLLCITYYCFLLSTLLCPDLAFRSLPGSVGS